MTSDSHACEEPPVSNRAPVPDYESVSVEPGRSGTSPASSTRSARNSPCSSSRFCRCRPSRWTSGSFPPPSAYAPALRHRRCPHRERGRATATVRGTRLRHRGDLAAVRRPGGSQQRPGRHHHHRTEPVGAALMLTQHDGGGGGGSVFGGQTQREIQVTVAPRTAPASRPIAIPGTTWRPGPRNCGPRYSATEHPAG